MDHIFQHPELTSVIPQPLLTPNWIQFPTGSIPLHHLPRPPPLLMALVSSGSLPQVTSIFWIYGKSIIPLEQHYTWCRRKLANLGLAGAVS